MDNNDTVVHLQYPDTDHMSSLLSLVFASVAWRRVVKVLVFMAFIKNWALLPIKLADNISICFGKNYPFNIIQPLVCKRSKISTSTTGPAG